MRCLECGAEINQLNNQHLLGCCGLTLQEVCIRRHMPLDLVLQPEQIDRPEDLVGYPRLNVALPAQAQNVLAGINAAGRLEEKNGFAMIHGDIKRLELLLWNLQSLAVLGFQFRQEYVYGETHRVVAQNRLKAHAENVRKHVSPLLEAPDFLQGLAVLVAHSGEIRSGYLFISTALSQNSDGLIETLRRRHGIACLQLDGVDDIRILLRTKTIEDTERLLALLHSHLIELPFAKQQFYDKGTEATVSKELVFDSAHFITDHPGKCSNLHGGRYVMNIKVKDRINPATGFVMDYSELKAVVKHRIIEKLDHQNLNYVAAELAWRSSTELLCLYIWEKLIDYLPGLHELEIHETATSCCRYHGPTLAEFQQAGQNALLSHFSSDRLGRSALRRLIRPKAPNPLKVVGETLD